MKTAKENITYLNIDFEVTLCFEVNIQMDVTFGLDQITLMDSEVDLIPVLEDKIIIELERLATYQYMQFICNN